MKYVLASASPRRRELLALIKEDFIIDVPKNEEKCPLEIAPTERPAFLAAQKAREVAARHVDALIIAADTAVFLDGKMLGKPHSKAEAEEMLTALSGRTHTVITGCCVIMGEREESFSVSTEVTFYPLRREEISSYIESNEPMDKAGAYGIQGRGAILVKEIKGDYFNVVGLPVAELYRKIEHMTSQG